MNIGVYNSLSGEEKAKAEAKMLRVKEAAEAARLRSLAAQGKPTIR